MSKKRNSHDEKGLKVAVQLLNDALAAS